MNRAKTWLSAHSLSWKCGLLLVIGLLLLGWLLKTPAGLLGKSDAIGYAVCHRIDSRSFHIGERQTPLCARCSGMFLGALVGLAYQARVGGRRSGIPPKRVLFPLILMGVAFAVDGVNSYLNFFPGLSGLYEPQNWLRLVTGSGMGLVLAAALFPAFNQTVWVDWVDQPALTGLSSLGLLVVSVGVVDLLVLSEEPIVLYPLAIISSASVMILLTLVYTLVLLMLFQHENKIQRWRILLFPLLGGFCLSLIQVSMLDFIRFLFTKTWGGFPLL